MLQCLGSLPTLAHPAAPLSVHQAGSGHLRLSRHHAQIMPRSDDPWQASFTERLLDTKGTYLYTAVCAWVSTDPGFYR
jgi:hypothetical protein